MQIRVGYELNYEFPQPTPMILTLNIHHSRVSDLARPDHMKTTPSVPIAAYRDGFRKLVHAAWWPRRGSFASPATRSSTTRARSIRSTRPRSSISVQQLPQETLVFLLGSRYCETDRLSEIAWDLFAKGPLGWARVQAICDFVHEHIKFGYEHASPTKTAWEVFNERKGVCRDFAHLAITLCRCMNIPARYCTGYLGDIGVPPPDPRRWTSRLVRGLSRRPLAHVRCAQQRPAHRPHPDRARPRRRRRRDHHDLRPEHAAELPRVDRRSGRVRR